jgi:hypothetical protein
MKKISKTCPICSKEFSVPFCHSNRHITCGYVCAGKLRRKPTIKNICFSCKKEFISKKSPTSPQKFCSRQCCAEVKKKTIERTCHECKKIFYITPFRLAEGSGRGTFCSRKCLLEKWNRNSINAQCPGSYRQNAWKIFEKRCYDCGIKDERVLLIHHIDGNRKNGLIENLIPICHNCHAIRHLKLIDNKKISSVKRNA